MRVSNLYDYAYVHMKGQTVHLGPSSFSSFYRKTENIHKFWNAGVSTLEVAFHIFLNFLGVGWDWWVQLVGRTLIGLSYQPRMIDKYGEFGGMRMGRGNRSTHRNPTPDKLCPPQIPHDVTWDRTRAPAAVGSQRLTNLSYVTAGFILHRSSKVS
jgi:hypothetical protein